MKDELISRQAAIDAVNRAVTKEAAIWSVKELPSAQRWIPCSERLPKEFESVRVCYKSQGGMAQAVSERITNADGSNRWSALAGVEPIAWMPLSEPYKADKEGET